MEYTWWLTAIRELMNNHSCNSCPWFSLKIHQTWLRHDQNGISFNCFRSLTLPINKIYLGLYNGTGQKKREWRMFPGIQPSTKRVLEILGSLSTEEKQLSSEAFLRNVVEKITWTESSLQPLEFTGLHLYRPDLAPLTNWYPNTGRRQDR